MCPMYVALHEVTQHVAWLYSVYTEHAQMAVVSHCTSHVKPNSAVSMPLKMGLYTVLKPCLKGENTNIPKMISNLKKSKNVNLFQN